MIESLKALVLAEPWIVAVEIGVIWLVVFLAYRFFRGTRGGGAMSFILLLLVGSFVVRVIGQGNDIFERLEHLYDSFLGYAALMLMIIFQPELRQAMIRLGHAWSFGSRRGEVRSTAATLAEACRYLGRAKFGAIIALERRTQLGGMAESGVELDAQLSPRLLESIFYPNSPLHDLGVVIRGDRVVAASVQFPMAEDGVLPPEYGARHRAAVGLTTECDALVVVVSEETGEIRLADRGRIDGPFEPTDLAEELVRRLARDASADEAEAEAAADADAESDVSESAIASDGEAATGALPGAEGGPDSLPRRSA